jgi:hypothetical protein
MLVDSIYPSLRNAALLVCAVMREDLKETWPEKPYDFHSATCSCIAELREALTLSWIFPQTGIFARIFSLYIIRRGAAKLQWEVA